MSSQPLDDFAAKTHAQLAGYSAQAALIRRNQPTNHTCDDRAACRGCAGLRDLSVLINDCIDQLREARLLAALDLEPA